MKKTLLLLLGITFSNIVISQVKESYPANFRKAIVPAALRNYAIRSSDETIDKQENHINNNPEVFRKTPSIVTSMNDITEVIGVTKYDLQTSHSIGNRISWNNDGSISAAWTYSPDAQTTYPNRGTGYNYYNGTAWAGPQSSDSVRTGFPNIVVTPLGREMIINHALVPNTTYNRILIKWRPVKGTGVWDTISPWGFTSDHTWAKGCSGLTNENVYVIWNDNSNPGVNPPHGPLLFSRSLNGGQTWGAATSINLINSAFYDGFNGDSYSIDATGDTVAISIGDVFTDVILLKSFDAGINWTKTIIQKHPVPHYFACLCGTYFIGNDTIPDTVHANGGDSKVILDQQGMAHVFFSALDYHGDTIISYYQPHYATDNLFYWNESMGPDTTTVWDPNLGGHGGYVAIAAAEDFSGNGILDVPSDTFTNCTSLLPWGSYGGGITQMPSCSIDELGNIYVSYQTINELADTTTWHMAHRHIYIMKLFAPAYNTFTVPYNIVLSQNQGGNGEEEECVYASMARRASSIANTGIILYQRDQIPGNSLAVAGSCDYVKNLNGQNEMVVCRADLIVNAINDIIPEDIKVSLNYPNPASSTTTIDIDLRKSAGLKIELYDFMGRVVYREEIAKAGTGTHTFILDTSELANGIYTYTVTAGEIRTSRKMIVQ